MKTLYEKKTQEITLTIGIFFDGTGNNAANTQSMLRVYFDNHDTLHDRDAENALVKYARAHFAVSGVKATSYMGYYTNIYWLSSLYNTTAVSDGSAMQKSIYIGGIGTQAGKPDSIIGTGFGIADTGVIAKTREAVSRLKPTISDAVSDLRSQYPGGELVIKSLRFDVFGFSRGAAAARHFANSIQSEDQSIINAIRQGLAGVIFRGSPSGRTRFIGIFDTVTAIGTLNNGMDPHGAETGDINIILRPGVAEKVFHITAQNECRYNFALHSVKPAWPELMLPGSHSDIGGGYLPVTTENVFLSRPATETVAFIQPGEKTQVYKKTIAQREVLNRSPCIAPLLRTNQVLTETWYDDRAPADRYGQMQKRSYAALTIRDRIVNNAWSLVALRVMIEAASESGVQFTSIHQADDELRLPDELIPLYEKALRMGEAVRRGTIPETYTQSELDTIAGKYVHFSAHWNTVKVTKDGKIHGGAAPSERAGFINRPDEQWIRTVYNMDGRNAQPAADIRCYRF
jgi:hypothetical protein